MYVKSNKASMVVLQYVLLFWMMFYTEYKIFSLHKLWNLTPARLFPSCCSTGLYGIILWLFIFLSRSVA